MLLAASFSWIILGDWVLIFGKGVFGYVAFPHHLAADLVLILLYLLHRFEHQQALASVAPLHQGIEGDVYLLPVQGDNLIPQGLGQPENVKGDQLRNHGLHRLTYQREGDPLQQLLGGGVEKGDGALPWISS